MAIGCHRIESCNLKREPFTHISLWNAKASNFIDRLDHDGSVLACAESMAQNYWWNEIVSWTIFNIREWATAFRCIEPVNVAGQSEIHTIWCECDMNGWRNQWTMPQINNSSICLHLSLNKSAAMHLSIVRFVLECPDTNICRKHYDRYNKWFYELTRNLYLEIIKRKTKSATWICIQKLTVQRNVNGSTNELFSATGSLRTKLEPPITLLVTSPNEHPFNTPGCACTVFCWYSFKHSRNAVAHCGHPVVFVLRILNGTPQQ